MAERRHASVLINNRCEGNAPLTVQALRVIPGNITSSEKRAIKNGSRRRRVGYVHYSLLLHLALCLPHYRN